jgi:hypothetical protein
MLDHLFVYRNILQFFSQYLAITDYLTMKEKHIRMPCGYGFFYFLYPSTVDMVLEDNLLGTYNYCIVVSHCTPHFDDVLLLDLLVHLVRFY